MRSYHLENQNPTRIQRGIDDLVEQEMLSAAKSTERCGGTRRVCSNSVLMARLAVARDLGRGPVIIVRGTPPIPDAIARSGLSKTVTESRQEIIDHRSSRRAKAQAIYKRNNRQIGGLISAALVAFATDLLIETTLTRTVLATHSSCRVGAHWHWQPVAVSHVMRQVKAQQSHVA